jgi:hypothetical protein
VTTRSRFLFISGVNDRAQWQFQFGRSERSTSTGPGHYVPTDRRPEGPFDRTTIPTPPPQALEMQGITTINFTLCRHGLETGQRSDSKQSQCERRHGDLASHTLIEVNQLKSYTAGHSCSRLQLFSLQHTLRVTCPVLQTVLTFCVGRRQWNSPGVASPRNISVIQVR